MTKKANPRVPVSLPNSAIAELLAVAAEHAKMPLQKALRRASRKALMWPAEAELTLKQNHTLIELAGVGPSLNRIIRSWIEDPPSIPEVPPIRANFLTATEVGALLGMQPEWKTKLKGDLQMHTLWSDGAGSVEEMARAGLAQGYQYIAITDHSQGLKIAGGINERQLQEQAEEIELVNRTLQAEGLAFKVLRSVELNLDPVGRGDMEDKSLEDLDLVLGCFHSALRKKDDQTDRYIAALRNPQIQILGHPRGRIYNFRLGLAADWPRVFGVAAELDKAVEIDGYPDRQDLSVDLLRLVKQAGCRISLGTDAHDPLQLRFMEYSLAAAIRAGIPPERILNFMSIDELRSWSRMVRQRKAPTTSVA
ncbi:MAG: PHP domain-containing protein [Acidobacteria bacterium]|nr:PHP domain-containing protein [Acidobacteriota bacterium]